MWIANVSYWGFNQYIIQRALAAKSLDEAQKGVIFAAFLKLLMPVIIVLPGIAAVMLAPGLAKPDEAYPTMMRLLPPGLLGLVFAALVAAIVASTASKINSIATIFTLDLYAKFRGERTRAEDDQGESAGEEKHLVLVGRITAVVAILIAILVGAAAARQAPSRRSSTSRNSPASSRRESPSSSCSACSGSARPRPARSSQR